MIKLLTACLIGTIILFSAQLYGQGNLASALRIQTKSVFTPPVTVSPGKVGQGVAVCPNGTVATSGGYFVNIPVKTNIVASFPVTTPPIREWVVEAFNPTSQNARFQTYVVCASLIP
jgi:hypothetical protein